MIIDINIEISRQCQKKIRENSYGIVHIKDVFFKNLPISGHERPQYDHTEFAVS